MRATRYDKSLMAYFGILVVLFTALISGDRSLGDQRNYLAGFYMLTPALATLIARLFFCEPRFTDANLRLGGVSDYLKFQLASLRILALSFAFYAVFGAVRWDITGSTFLKRLDQQFAASGRSMRES